MASKSRFFLNIRRLDDDRVAREWIPEEARAKSLRGTIKGFTFTIFLSRARGQEDTRRGCFLKGKSRSTEDLIRRLSPFLPSRPLDSDPFESPLVGTRELHPASAGTKSDAFIRFHFDVRDATPAVGNCLTSDCDCV